MMMVQENLFQKKQYTRIYAIIFQVGEILLQFLCYVFHKGEILQHSYSNNLLDNNCIYQLII